MPVDDKPVKAAIDERVNAVDTEHYAEQAFVSLIGNQNYAHLGEEEAIERCMQYFSRDASQSVLDVACGLGKTANELRAKGYGDVVGLDINPAFIEQARNAYPQCRFVLSDAHTMSDVLPHDFDIVTVYNSFSNFHDGAAALRQLSQCTRKHGQLMIFDSVDLTAGNNPLYRQPSDDNPPFYPVQLERFKHDLVDSGWGDIHVVCLDDDFERWRARLVLQILAAREKIIARLGHAYFVRVYQRYAKGLDATLSGQLGGAVIYAVKV